MEQGSGSGLGFEKGDGRFQGHGRGWVSGWGSRLGFGIKVWVQFRERGGGQVSGRGSMVRFQDRSLGRVSIMELWSSFEIEVEVKFQDGVGVGFRDTGRGWVSR